MPINGLCCTSLPKPNSLYTSHGFSTRKATPHFGGSRNVLTTSGVVFLGEIGRVSTPKVDAVVQERFKKMIRFKRVPGQENGRPVMGNPWWPHFVAMISWKGFLFTAFSKWPFVLKCWKRMSWKDSLKILYMIYGLVCFGTPPSVNKAEGQCGWLEWSGERSGCLTEHMFYQHWLSKCFANTHMFMVTLMMATLGYCANSENYDRTRSFYFLLGGLEHVFFSHNIYIYIYIWDNPSHWLSYFSEG